MLFFSLFICFPHSVGAVISVNPEKPGELFNILYWLGMNSTHGEDIKKKEKKSKITSRVLSSLLLRWTYLHLGWCRSPLWEWVWSHHLGWEWERTGKRLPLLRLIQSTLQNCWMVGICTWPGQEHRKQKELKARSAERIEEIERTEYQQDLKTNGDYIRALVLAISQFKYCTC